MSNNDDRLPSRLKKKFPSNDMKRSIDIMREMIVYRRYTSAIKCKNYEVFVNENDEITYLLPFANTDKDSISKEIFVNMLSSTIDHDIHNPRIIILSYVKASDHINKIISNSDEQLLYIYLADTKTKTNYSYIREWIISKQPCFEWFLINDVPKNFLSLIPKHELDNDYKGEVQSISSSELIVRYNLWKIGDIVKINRENEAPVRRKVV